MNGFKLIAIRPLKKCDERLLKVIKPSNIYKFYQNYEFKNDRGELVEANSEAPVERVVFNSTMPNDFYSTENLSINVSAIVGKNGSGKSTLIELLFASVYCIAIKAEILENKSLFRPLGNLFVEIFYSIEGKLLCIRVESTVLNHLFKIHEYTYNQDKNEFELKDTPENETTLLKNFFYTIAVNYSIYGLNSLQMGNWVEALFHKNDGYQTPVVINPFREEGVININRELYLAKQRLLSNLILNIHQQSTGTDYRVTETQKITSITFRLDRSKIECAFERSVDDKVAFEDFFKTDSKETIMKAFYDFFCDRGEPMVDLKYKEEVERYVIRKLIKIARTYKQYYQFFNDNLIYQPGTPGDTKTNAVTYSSHFNFLEAFIVALKDDKSHLTFKLRQARNYLLNGSLQDGIDGFNWVIKTDHESHEYEELVVDLKSLSNRILQFKPASERLIEFIPPSIFSVEFNLISNNSQQSIFGFLSSGEQQQIHTIQSVLYHLLNLDSVHYSEVEDSSRLIYSNVNIVLDEIELYFHPEFQRSFLTRLIEGLKLTPLPSIKNVNILFSTHSPFILSDISVKSILGLDDGAVTKFIDKETFGANIHDLLRNEFFLSKGFMGEFAKHKINEVIDFLRKIKLERQKENWKMKENDKLNELQYKILEEELSLLEGTNEFSKEEITLFLNMIGEPALKSSLSELIREAYPYRSN